MLELIARAPIPIASRRPFTVAKNVHMLCSSEKKKLDQATTDRTFPDSLTFACLPSDLLVFTETVDIRD